MNNILITGFVGSQMKKKASKKKLKDAIKKQKDFLNHNVNKES
jgi:hypothetical protein